MRIRDRVDRVWYLVGARVSNRVWVSNSVWLRVYDRVSSRVGNRVGNRVWDRVWDRLLEEQR